MNEIPTRLKKCFSVVFPSLSVSEIERADQESVEQWDSVAHITLLTVVDEEFGISTDIEDAEELTSYAALLDHVRAVATAG